MSRSSNSEPGLSDAADASDSGPSADTVPDTAEAFGLGDVTWADDAAVDEIPGEGAMGSEDSSDPDLSAGQDGAVQDGAVQDGAVQDGAVQDGPGDVADGTEATDDDRVAADVGPIAVEDLVQDLERVAIERDQYLDASRRLQAEFENYRKVVAKREIEAQQRANESLVNDILPVLDACDAAVLNGAEDVGPVHATLVEALAKNGLERIDDVEASFDPERHDAVMHEPAEGEDDDGPVVAEVMRAGYLWKGRVLRPAMVRVRG